MCKDSKQTIVSNIYHRIRILTQSRSFKQYTIDATTRVSKQNTFIQETTNRRLKISLKMGILSGLYTLKSCQNVRIYMHTFS